jgi:hypothetical protein
MNLIAVGIGFGIILLSIIGVFLLYKFKKDRKIVKSIFR